MQAELIKSLVLGGNAVCADDEQEESPFLRQYHFFFMSLVLKMIKDEVWSISFVIVGRNFILTKNDVIFILFLRWPCEISSSMFHALCGRRVESNSNSSSFWRICACRRGCRHCEGVLWRLLASFVRKSPGLPGWQSGQCPQKNVEKKKFLECIRVVGKQLFPHAGLKLAQRHFSF